MEKKNSTAPRRHGDAVCHRRPRLRPGLRAAAPGVHGVRQEKKEFPERERDLPSSSFLTFFVFSRSKQSKPKPTTATFSRCPSWSPGVAGAPVRRGRRQRRRACSSSVRFFFFFLLSLLSSSFRPFFLLGIRGPLIRPPAPAPRGDTSFLFPPELSILRGPASPLFFFYCCFMIYMKRKNGFEREKIIGTYSRFPTPRCRRGAF